MVKNVDRMMEEGEMDEIIEKDSDFSAHDLYGDPLLRIYLKELANYSPLTVEGEQRLFAALEKAKRLENDKEIERTKKEIALANLGLVVSIAKKYYKASTLSFLDLIQEGNTGLMMVIDRFDHRKGNKFSTYAVWWIRQSIERAIADSSRTIRIPIHIQNGAKAIGRSRAELCKKGKEVTTEMLSEETNMSPERIERIAAAQTLNRLYSLDSVLPEDEDGTLEFGDLIADEAPSPEDEVARKELRARIESVLDELSERDANILRMRYGLVDGVRQTLQQVGDMFQISRERVRQIQSKSLGELRDPQRKHQLASFLDI